VGLTALSRTCLSDSGQCSWRNDDPYFVGGLALFFIGLAANVTGVAVMVYGEAQLSPAPASYTAPPVVSVAF
jgi:hypothetical protein